MKILDIPQSGKKGIDVSQQGRFGQYRRTLGLVANPRTTAQVAVRGIFARVTSAWRTLTRAQQLAWNAAAAGYMSAPRCGTSGPLSGSLLFNKVNCVNLTFGQAVVNDPPGRAEYPDLAPINLIITNTAGVIALKLTCPTDPGDTTYVRAAAPQSNGRFALPSFRILGAVPPPVAGNADITGIYTARFGVPPAGTKVFVQVFQVVNGLESLPTDFDATVPHA